jgi:D-aspartate ligase
VRPLACVLGDVDLVTPLALAGIRSVPVVPAGDPATFSRFTTSALEPLDHWREQEALVERLLRWAASQPVAPVLFYQTDGDLLLVSRHREELARRFRFVIPDATLVEDLADKARFQKLAERLGLPVPRARHLRAAGGVEPAMDLSFPVVVKPLTRQGLALIERDGKAIHVGSPRAMERLWPTITAGGVDVVAQELVPGPEERIESYHAYVDGDGEIAGEFTGAKIRTYPAEFGHTTALRITSSPDVAAHGRSLVALLGLRGVVKIDYKRDPEGTLRLLEVNPRFNLWHHPGAVAGVNLPALAYADLTGEPRPPSGPLRPGVTWCQPWDDRKAARAAGLSTVAWMTWAIRCDARSGAGWNDPMPFLRAVFWPKVRRRVSVAVRSGRGGHQRGGDRG